MQGLPQGVMYILFLERNKLVNVVGKQMDEWMFTTKMAIYITTPRVI